MAWRFATKLLTFESLLYATVYKLLYYLNIGLCWLLNAGYDVLERLAGMCRTSYDGNFDVLWGFLFTNGTASGIFWIFVALTVLFAIAFAALSLIRRDSGDEKMICRSKKEIFRGLGRTVSVVISVSLALIILLNATGMLMQQAKYAWIDAETPYDETVVFSEEEFAAMARVLNTIGNYSLNPAYNNRYNINSCFNEIRPDMQYLASCGIFRYNAEALYGEDVATWQAALQKIASAASLSRELKIDVHYEDVSNAILETMDLMRVNGTFKPLESYELQHRSTEASLPLDRAIFLLATMRSAKNNDYNIEPSLTDALRSAYYYGEKIIYDLDTVNEDFDIGKSAIEFAVVIAGCLLLLKSLIVIVLNLISRMVNMMMLYFDSVPTVFGSIRCGSKRVKRWIYAFAVNAAALLATLVLVRALLILLPLIVMANIQIHPVCDVLIKMTVLAVTFAAAERLTCLISAKIATFEAQRSIHVEERFAGKKTSFVTFVGAVKTAGSHCKQTLQLCTFAGVEPEDPETAEEESVDCDAALLEKFKSWNNSNSD